MENYTELAELVDDVAESVRKMYLRSDYAVVFDVCKKWRRFVYGASSSAPCADGAYLRALVEDDQEQTVWQCLLTTMRKATDKAMAEATAEREAHSARETPEQYTMRYAHNTTLKGVSELARALAWMVYDAAMYGVEYNSDDYTLILRGGEGNVDFSFIPYK